MVWLHPGGDSAQLFVAGLGLPALLAFSQSRAPVRFAACVATMLVAGSLAANAQGQALYVSRTFFGVYRVMTDQDGSISLPVSRHDAARHAGGRSGASGRGVDVLPPARADRPGVRGAAGSCGAARASRSWGLASERWRATGRPDSSGRSTRSIPRSSELPAPTSYFTYLRSCGESCRVVLGDARLSLARAPLHEYGLIVLDAFSSDAIPIHLMTTEALGLYLSRLAPGRRAGVSHLEPAPGPCAGACATRVQPRTCCPPATAQRRPIDHGRARTLVIRVDGDGQERNRSRPAGDRHPLDRAGDAAVDAVVDR